MGSVNLALCFYKKVLHLFIFVLKYFDNQSFLFFSNLSIYLFIRVKNQEDFL